MMHKLLCYYIYMHIHTISNTKLIAINLFTCNQSVGKMMITWWVKDEKGYKSTEALTLKFISQYLYLGMRTLCRNNFRNNRMQKESGIMLE